MGSRQIRQLLALGHSSATALPKKSNEKFSKAKIIEALRHSRGMIAIAARVLGCGRQCIYDAIKRHPEINEVVAGERDLMIDTAELKLAEAITKGQPWAIAMSLKTIGRNRGYVERQENVNTDVSMEELLGFSHIKTPGNGAA